jgi:membrane protease YdiL (CAAX protease family)
LLAGPLLGVVLSVPLSLFAFAVATDFQGDFSDLADYDSWSSQLTPLEFLFLFVVPGQVLLIALALSFGLASRRPLCQSLGLTRPRLSWTWVLLCALGSFTPGILGSLVAGRFFGEPSHQLLQIEWLIREPRGPLVALTLAFLSLGPGFAEELFFRGAVQQSLQRAWPAPPAILITGLFFALQHMDPMHATGVLPIGLWLSFVAWAARSVWPSMICHAAYNGVLFYATRAFGPEDDLPAWPLYLIGASVLAFCVSLPLLLRAGLKRP